MEDLSKEQFDNSKQKLQDLDARDEIKKAKERALNNLETQVIDTREKMYEEIFEKSTTDEEKEKIQAKCSELSDWIDEEVTLETPVDILEAKLKELTDLTAGLHARVKVRLCTKARLRIKFLNVEVEKACSRGKYVCMAIFYECQNLMFERVLQIWF